MSKHKNQTKRFPLVEAKVRLWLAEQYRLRGMTGPWQINARMVAKEMGGFHATVGAALAHFSRGQHEGVTAITHGQYEYQPPRKAPTPAVLAGRTRPPAPAPAPPVAEPVAAPAAAPKPRRTLDMTVRPKLVEYARRRWAMERKPVIVVAAELARELGLNVGSTQGAMRYLAGNVPESGYEFTGARGVYRIVRPRRARQVAEEEPERDYAFEETDAPEEAGEQEPQHAEPAQPEPQPGPPEPPPAVEQEPGPASAAAFNAHISGLAEEVMRRMAQNGQEPEWETVRKGESFAVLMDSEGGVWHARKLELS